MDIASVLTGTGSAALVVAVAYAGRLGLDWWRERRTTPTAASRAASAAVGDAATANALLLASLHEEREEVQRLSGRVQELETQNALLYERMRDQGREYEREISALRGQVDEFRRQLDSLQERLRTSDPGRP